MHMTWQQHLGWAPTLPDCILVLHDMVEGLHAKLVAAALLLALLTEVDLRRHSYCFARSLSQPFQVLLDPGDTKVATQPKVV
jgi:hypothetical protein